MENKDNNLEGQRGKGGQEFPISPKQMAFMTPIFCSFRLTPPGPIQSSLQRAKHAHTNKHTAEKISNSQMFIMQIHISFSYFHSGTV